MSEHYPSSPLRDVVKPIVRPSPPLPGQIYRQLGVQLWGRGAYERAKLEGSQTKYKTLSRVQAGDIVVNKIWARNGSVAVVPSELSGCYVSGEFPTFVPMPDKLEPAWFHWYTKTPVLWQQCDEKSRGTSGKNRIRPERFLEIEIPIPTLHEQRRVVSRIEGFSRKIHEIINLRAECAVEQARMLLAAYRNVVEGAEWLLMGDVAPLVRRPITVEALHEYHELGIRSFGRGTFHKPPVTGTMLGSKRIFLIEPHDLLFNIVFAWEGAVAVAQPNDKGRVGSHRFLTCVPRDAGILTSFLAFHFLTDRGLEDLGIASPGGAGRNRTLGIEALARIKVPVPTPEKQRWFASLLEKAQAVDRLQAEVNTELDALMPSILSKAFSGEL